MHSIIQCRGRCCHFERDFMDGRIQYLFRGRAFRGHVEPRWRLWKIPDSARHVEHHREHRCPFYSVFLNLQIILPVLVAVTRYVFSICSFSAILSVSQIPWSTQAGLQGSITAALTRRGRINRRDRFRGGYCISELYISLDWRKLSTICIYASGKLLAIDWSGT
jgi:hypothetical protein